jgi:hypothetical protein
MSTETENKVKLALANMRIALRGKFIVDPSRIIEVKIKDVFNTGNDNGVMIQSFILLYPDEEGLETRLTVRGVECIEAICGELTEDDKFSKIKYGKDGKTPLTMKSIKKEFLKQNSKGAYWIGLEKQ